MDDHADTVRQYANDLSLNRGIPSGDLSRAADYIENLEDALVEVIEILEGFVYDYDEEPGVKGDWSYQVGIRDARQWLERHEKLRAEDK